MRRGGSRSPLAYLRSLVGSDGAIRYSRTSTQTPVWVTAQALTALAGKAFPLRAGAARAPRGRDVRSPTPAPTATPTPRPAGEPAGKPAPTAEPAALASAPSGPAPAVTPMTMLALALPAVTPDRAHGAGVIAAVIATTWLPR